MADSIDPRIESLLVDLKRREQTSDAEVSALRQAIGESPYLAQLIETTLDRGVLQRFTTQSIPGTGGHFTDVGGSLSVSRQTLQGAAKSEEGIDPLVGALAHEAAHAANQQDRLFRAKQFERDLGTRFATDSDVHDPTDIALTLQQRQRWDESYAELHSVNAIVSRIRHLDPQASTKEILERTAPSSMCVVRDAATETFDWAPGIQTKPDGRIAYSPGNIEAVGRCHFDAPASEAKLGPHGDLDYRNYYAPHAMGRIADLKIEADNAIANPLAGPDPPLHLNLGRLG